MKKKIWEILLLTSLGLIVTLSLVHNTVSAAKLHIITRKINKVFQSAITAGGRTGATGIAPPPTNNTWYVNSGGGTRFSVNVAGQCDGLSPNPYPGSGTNQHCAFNDIRYLWTDASFNTDPNAGAPKWGWIGVGGDTYLIDCSGMPNSSCRIGQSGPNSGDGFGLFGSPQQAGAPQLPAGTSGAHTKVYGINHASCSSPSSYTHINGGYGVGAAFSLSGTSWVDFECFDITDSSICTKGESQSPNPCSTSFPLSDYAANGVQFYWNATNIEVSNVYVHGTANSCFFGPTGDGTTVTNVILAGCPHSTWDLDPGDGTTGTGNLTLNNLNIVFSGFEEVYPINHANDLTFTWGTVSQPGDGSDQSHGGYGDCFGTATVTSSPAWIVHVNGGSFQYCTQDGFDGLHLTGNGSQAIINGFISYGNMGQQLKLGSAGTVTNSLFVHNTNALKFLPGLALDAVSQLSDYGRAGDAAVVLAISDGTTTTFEFNTVIGAGVIAQEIALNSPCTGSTCILIEKNNVMLGYQNSVANGYYPGVANGNFPDPMFFDSTNPFTFGASVADHNTTFHQKVSTPCPNTGIGETNAICTTPNLAIQNWMLFSLGNNQPTGTPLVGAGITIGGITTDLLGNTRNNPPTEGAYENAVTTHTWYVTTGGSDSNPCTAASPCATPTHVVNSVAQPGDFVEVAAGTYSYGGSAAQFNVGGSAGLPITVTCQVTGGCQITNTVTGNSTVVYIHAQYINFDGFEVTNTGAGNNLGIYVDVSNVGLTRNNVHDIQTDCSSLGGGGVQIATVNVTNIFIDSNTIHNISWVSGAPKCNSSTVQTDGILSEQTGFTTNTIISNNLVYNTSGGWGIGASTNAQIINNTIFNTVNGGVVINNAPSGAAVQGNIIVYTGLHASDGLFYGGACAVQNGTASTTTYSNNDLFGNHGGNYGTGFGCSGSGLNSGDIAVDPASGTTFVNWQQNGSGDYHEKTGSPTISAAMRLQNLQHDLDGNQRPHVNSALPASYDMGAYQK